MVSGIWSILEVSGKDEADVEDGAGFGGPSNKHVLAVFKRRPLFPVLQ